MASPTTSLDTANRSTLLSRLRWKRLSDKMKVLIDRNIEINAITHKTKLTQQVLRWGPHNQIVEVLQRAHFPPRADESFRKEQIPYLITLCAFAKKGKLQFFTSDELRMEKLRPKRRCEGYLGVNLLQDVAVHSVRCPVKRLILFAPTGNVGVTEDEQMEFFRSIRDPRFLKIRNVMGDAHIDDAFHLWTAEEARLDALLTMDQRFWRVVNQKKKMIGSTIPVVTPKKLGEHLNAKPTNIEKLAAEINSFT